MCIKNMKDELQKAFIDYDQEPLFSLTLLLNDAGKLNVYFIFLNFLLHFLFIVVNIQMLLFLERKYSNEGVFPSK